jgi:hypothetical protein
MARQAARPGIRPERPDDCKLHGLESKDMPLSRAQVRSSQQVHLKQYHGQQLARRRGAACTRRRHRRAVPALVLPARPVQGEEGPGRAAAVAAVPQQGRQPEHGHPDHPVADPAGSFFAVSVYMQEVNGYNAIQTGLMLTPATIGILAASAGADRVDTGAAAVRRRGRGHADLLGQRGPVQLPGRRPGPDLWGCPAESPAKG